MGVVMGVVMGSVMGVVMGSVMGVVIGVGEDRGGNGRRQVITAHLKAPAHSRTPKPGRD
jgi:hypothetical protein